MICLRCTGVATRATTASMLVIAMHPDVDPLAQSVEHLPFKQGVDGSSPSRVTFLFWRQCRKHIGWVRNDTRHGCGFTTHRILTSGTPTGCFSRTNAKLRLDFNSGHPNVRFRPGFLIHTAPMHRYTPAWIPPAPTHRYIGGLIPPTPPHR